MATTSITHPESPARCGRECPGLGLYARTCGDSWFALLLSSWFSRPENPCDRCRQPVPLAGLDHQLPLAFRRQSVKLRTPIVFRRAFLDRDPSPLDESMQRGI